MVSTDAAGNSSNNTELNAIDTTAPTTPTMTAPTTGSPVVGTAQPGTMVIITTPSGATCTTNADASGNYICSLSPTPVD